MRTRFAAVCLIAALLAFPLPARAATTVQIAVLDFAGPEETWIGRGIALLIERELLARDGVVVLDRRHLGTVLDEAELAASGLLTPKARRSLEVGAIDYAIVGTWKRAEGGGIRISALVLDTESGATVAHAMETATIAELSAAAARLTKKIATNLASRAPGIAAPPRFVLPPVPAGEIASLTLAAEAEEKGDYPTAHLHIRKGLTGSPDSAVLRLALGRLLLRMGEPLHAALSLREAAAGGNPAVASEALSLLARVFEHDLGRFDLAATAYRELIRRFPHVGDVERSRIREIELLDRAGRGADAYLRLMEHRDRLLARVQNLDENTRWFGYPYQRLAGEVGGLESMLAQRYVDLPDAERSGLPRPRTVHLIAEDGLSLELGAADPLENPNRTRRLIAPEGRSIVSVEIAADTGPDQGIPPVSIPESQIGVRISAGWQVLRFGTGNAPRGVEVKTLVFDEPARIQSFSVDTMHRWRRLHGMVVRIRLGPAAKKSARTPWPDPEGTERIVKGVAGAVSWLDAVATGADLAIVFCDVATFLGPGSGGYPWPIGKDADLYLARRKADGETTVERLPLSSEQEDIFPTLARGPGGLWRLFWLSNRRTGFVFEPFTATSEDLRHWTWPRPVDLGIRAKPGFARDLMWANLSATVPLSAPRLFAAPDGRWCLYGYANYGPGNHGTYLLISDDGERFKDPVLLSKGRPGPAILTANRKGGVEAIWVERTGELEPYATQFVHTLRRVRVAGGRVAEEMQIALGAPLQRNSQSTILRPWVGPTGEIYAGWARRPEPGPGETDHSFRPLLLRLFRVNDEGEAELLTSDTPIFGGTVTVATAKGIHMLRPWGRWHIGRAIEGGIDHWLADLPGRSIAAAPREPVDLPASERDPDAPLTAVVLPFVAQGSKNDAALGEAATALLLEAIAGGPQLRLVTRERLGTILSEVTTEERSGAAGRLRVGRLIGADIVYSGTIVVNGAESTIVIRELRVETTKVRLQTRWTGRTEILFPMLTSVAAEMANPWHDTETGVERFAEDAEARMHFVSSVSDVLSGINLRAAGGFFEALRLGLDYPPTRYWLARSLEDLGESAGAETEYTKYLAASPSGLFAEDARLRVDLVGDSMPKDTAWVPRVEASGGESDILRRIYRGRSMDERVAALKSYVAGPGRDRLDTLLEVFNLELDEWFRFQVLTSLRDLDPRLMFRAAAREVRSGASIENELGNFFRGIDARPWLKDCLLECLAPDQTPETAELWEGLGLLPSWPLGRGPLPDDLAAAVDTALRSNDLVRIDRALKLLTTNPCEGTFDLIAHIFDDVDLPDETRGRAAGALQASDPLRAWRHFEPRLIEGMDAELLKGRIYFIPVPIEPKRLRSLLLDEASEGWYGLLLEKAKQTIAAELGGIALEMMDSDSGLVRRRGLYLIEKKDLAAVPGLRAALSRISRRDPDPELRDLALNRRCWLGTEEDAAAILEDITRLSPEWRQRGALGSLSHALLFRPAPEPADGLEGWRVWLAFFRTERAKTGPLINELRSKVEPSPERALAILEALSGCRDPETVHAIADWLARYRRSAEAAPSPAVKRAARVAVNTILTSLGFAEHLLPGEGVQLQMWVMENDPGTFRPWRR